MVHHFCLTSTQNDIESVVCDQLDSIFNEDIIAPGIAVTTDIITITRVNIMVIDTDNWAQSGWTINL